VPTPEQIGQWSRQYGLTTIIDLRGRQVDTAYEASRAAAADAGAELLEIKFASQTLPRNASLRKQVWTLDRQQGPLLIHCHDGADRTGVVSVLAAMAVGGADYAAARGQLSMRYFHFGRDRRRIEGLLMLYEDHCARAGQSTGGWKQFKDWALTHYKQALADAQLEEGE
jgi:protein tyrosine/serine phosphatase